VRGLSILVAAALLAAPAPRAAADAHSLLRAVGQFDPGELAALDRGESIARVLKTGRREIAVLGAIRIHASRDRLLARYRDISHLRRSNLVLQAGTFSSTPSPRDLDIMTFDPYDVDAPKDCVPGDCAVRLSPQAIARFHEKVAWTLPDARQQSAAQWRFVLADVARAYAAGGDAALPVYANKRDPLRVQDEMTAVYDGFAAFAAAAPAFFRCVRDYPRSPLPGVENALYWSVNDLGIRPVMGITHQTIYAPASGPALIALKRIYAAHYVDAGLGVTMVVDDGAGGFYMATLERIRTRSLESFMRALVRSRVQDKSREGVEKMLRSSKRSLESRIPNH
jgi:hypothetical protein